MPFTGGGGGGPSSTEVTQTNIPNWLRPQVEGMLAQAARTLFDVTQTGVDAEGNPLYEVGGPKPYQPYSQAAYTRSGMPSGWESIAPLTAGQNRAIDIANWLGSPTGGQQLINEQYGRAGDFASQAGWHGADIGEQALGYGAAGMRAGAQGQQLGVAGGEKYGAAGMRAGEQGQQLGVAGGEKYGGMGAGYGQAAAGLAPRAAGLGGMYEQMATSPGEYEKYMSPYMANVVVQQQAGAQRQADVAAQTRKAAAARAGAYGGGRQAIENAEAQRALDTQLQNIQAQGLQQAYQQAQGNILNRAQLESQGLGQAGQLYGVGMQGAGMGLQGIQSQLAGTAQGMQGAGMGLQGLQSQLAGTAQGMQGAGMGLQGTQGALGGYGLMGQMGGQLANITGQRLKDVMGTAQFQYGMNEQQRQLAQQAINQQIQNWAMSQEMPYQRLSQLNALIRGYAMPGQTTTQYQAPPSGISQLAGLGTAAYGLSSLMGGPGKKAGGTVSSGEGIDRIALRRALAGD